MLGVRADEKLEGHANVGAEPSNWGVKARRKQGAGGGEEGRGVDAQPESRSF